MGTEIECEEEGMRMNLTGKGGEGMRGRKSYTTTKERGSSRYRKGAVVRRNVKNVIVFIAFVDVIVLIVKIYIQ